MKYPDLNLLVALDILLDEQSVAAAARRMNLSAPAMSRTLSRIRETVGDPILVRAGKRLVPTARALELRDLVHKTSEAAVGLLQVGSTAQLADLERQFTLRANDVFVAAYGAKLLRELRAKAPRITLRLRSETEVDDQALREGRVDLWVGATNTLDPEAQVQTLFTTRFVAVARRDHPIFDGAITPERFAAYDHINISRRGVNASPIDVRLSELGLTRTVAVVASTFLMGLPVLPGSDLIMPAPEHLVWGLAPLDSSIRAFEIPLRLEPFPIRQAWHPRQDNDAVHRWLRGTIHAVCRERPGPIDG